MKSSKLLQVFEKLELKDLRELKKWVRSPVVNQRQHVADLFEFLEECQRELKIVPDYETTHRAIFPKENFDEKRLRNSMNLLLKVIEKYFSQKYQKEEQALLLLGKAFRKIDLPKHYQQTIAKTRLLQDQSEQRHAEFYLTNYLLEYEQYQWLSSQRRLTDINLQTLSDNLDIAYLALKLRQTCFSLSHQAVFKTDYDFGLLPNFLEVLNKSPYSEIPAISLYYHCYLSLTDSVDETHFRKFKELLVKHSQLFPLQEIRDLFLLAANYCIRRLNDGSPQFAQEALDIYQEGLEKAYLISDGKLSRFTYSNIVTMSLVTQQYDWAIDFAEKYKPALVKDHQESTYSFNLARLEYSRGNLDKALLLLQKSEYRELVLNLTAKSLMAKIYFESEEHEVLTAHLDAMQQFIRRKKVIGYHREMFMNFATFLKKRTELPVFEKEQMANLKIELENFRVIAERRWLMTQI